MYTRRRCGWKKSPSSVINAGGSDVEFRLKLMPRRGDTKKERKKKSLIFSSGIHRTATDYVPTNVGDLS